MTEKKKVPIYSPDKLLTFAEFPEGTGGQPNIFGGHAQQGQAREAALKAFASGDKSVIVFSNDDHRARRIEDPDLVIWTPRYKPGQS